MYEKPKDKKNNYVIYSIDSYICNDYCNGFKLFVIQNDKPLRR